MLRVLFSGLLGMRSDGQTGIEDSCGCLKPGIERIRRKHVRCPAFPFLQFFVTATVLAQNPAPDPVIKVSVDLVQMDAVVTDSQGHHVAGLKPEDFRILEDGKPQRITAFSYAPQTPLKRTVDQGQAHRTITPVEPPPASPQGVKRDFVHRTMVLIADDLALSSDDIPNSKRALKKFVDDEMQPGDLASVMTTSGGMGVMAQLTSDKRQLYASIERIHWWAGRTGLTWYQPVHKIDVASEVENASIERLNAVRKPFLAAGTLAALSYVIEGLREMPGRKAIALFSDGFPESAAGIVQLANRASVAIYTLDPRGLVSFNLTAVDWCACGGNPQLVTAEESKRQAAYRATQHGLEELARGTGGMFFHDNNDLNQGMARAMADLDSYYLIGYQPHREVFETVRGKPQFHRIEIKILRPGLQVRSRNGFMGTPDAPIGSSSPHSVRDALRNALFSPFQADGFPVHLSAFYSASRDKDPRNAHRSSVLRAMLAIDAHGLRFKDAPDGKKQLDLDIVAASYGADNMAVASSNKSFRVALTEGEMSQLIASGVVYNLDMVIPKAGAYQFRVAVRDANSERMGSATTFVEIPDFNRPSLVLSSILLSDSDTNRNELLSRVGVLGPGSPVTRAFGPGAALSYDCEVFGVSSKPKIEMAINLFRGRERIFTGHPISVPARNGDVPVHTSGQIRLPDFLPPGDYAFELVVQDRGNVGGHAATQWTDFTLVK
jgi:VWFA-related protein